MSEFFWRRALQVTSTLLTVSILIQFFIAGMAAVTDPDYWGHHRTWAAVFQWLVVPLPVLAWLGGYPRRWRVMIATAPLLQIALQYVLAHRAMEGRLPIGIGLHAVNAGVLLIVSAIVAAGLLDWKLQK
jgi:hypothetical protein